MLFPQSKGLYTLKGYGNTQDIINTILAECDNSYLQCQEFSQQFKGLSVNEVCKKLFDFVNNNIKYKEDPLGDQWIRQPARFISDKTGDCKSYSLFINDCLRCLGIPFSFRFVGYTSGGDYTHVYPVAYDENGNEIIIDVVAFQLKGIDFNKEIPFVKKQDMTQARIAVLSGVGSAETVRTISKVNISSDDKLNVQEIKSLIDLLYSEASVSTNSENTYSLISQIMIYEIVLQLIDKYGSNAQSLELAGYVLAEKILNNDFTYKIDSEEEKNSFVAEVFGGIVSQMGELTSPLSSVNYALDKAFIAEVQDFISWWQSSVLAQNTKNPASIGITSSDWANLVKQGAPFYLYSTSNNTLSARKAEKKREFQMNMLNWLITHNTGLSKATIDNLVRSGATQYYGATPETTIALLASKGGKISGIGEVSNTYSSIIDSINLLSGSISTVADTVKQVRIAFGDESELYNSNLYQYAPAVSDWDSSILIPIVGAIGVLGGAYLLLKKKNQPETQRKGRR